MNWVVQAVGRLAGCNPVLFGGWEFESLTTHKMLLYANWNKQPDFQSGHRKMCAGSSPVGSTKGNYTVGVAGQTVNLLSSMTRVVQLHHFPQNLLGSTRWLRSQHFHCCRKLTFLRGSNPLPSTYTNTRTFSGTIQIFCWFSTN